jgi:cell division protein FtsZ
MENLFSSRFAFDDTSDEEAKICIVGVGGGGGNAINNMLEKGIHGVQFIAINTDAQALAMNRAPQKIQAGRGLTKGLGAGARPSVGAEAIEENREQLEQALQGFDMVFITAGMGGGTGTGGAPVVASIAKRLGILSVAIVTKPFDCEGKPRMMSAMQGIDALREHVDTVIVIPNQRLLGIAGETLLIDAFSIADEVLYNATRGISDLITVHGLINLDFADVKTTMQDGGAALMGAATASGENRAERAAIEAISSPLLDGLCITGAQNVLVNITAGKSLGIKEATDATSIIQREAGDDVEVIFGTVIDESMGDELRVTVIATGFDRPRKVEKVEKKPAEELVRPTPSLHAELPTYNYKGEENLKTLDVPAYVRRNSVAVHPIMLDREEPEATAVKRRVRRLNADDLRDRSERIRSEDSDTPAFLRKMLD